MAKKKKQSTKPVQRRARRRARLARPVTDPSPLTYTVIDHFDDAAHATLTARGWVPMGGEERGAFGGDTWDWPPSQVETDGEPWFESTGIHPTGDGFGVDTAAPQLTNAHGTVKYDTLDELLADIEIIEGFRYGDAFPSFPHGRVVTTPVPPHEQP